MSIASKIGCTGQTLNERVKKAEVDAGKQAGMPTDMAAKLKALERENREVRQANEILFSPVKFLTEWTGCWSAPLRVDRLRDRH